MSIKAIIFDYGQVLNAPRDVEQALENRVRLAARLGLSAEELWPYLFEGEAAARWMTGRLSWEKYWAAVLEPKGINDPDEQEAFAQAIFADTQHLHPEMVALLSELHGHYQLAVVSNASWTDDELFHLLHGNNNHSLPAELFEVIVTSATFGAVKPAPEIFRHALERLGVRPEEAIFTDDLVSFTDSAARVGIHSHPFSTPAEFRRYLERMGVLPVS